MVRSKFSPFRIRGRKSKLEQRSDKLLAVADEVRVGQLIGPLIKLAGDVVCRPQPFLCRRRTSSISRLLGAQVEHDVPLAVAPHTDPHPRRKGVLAEEEHFAEEKGATAMRVRGNHSKEIKPLHGK